MFSEQAVRPNLRVFDTPSLEVECLDSTVPEAEMTNVMVWEFPRWIPEISEWWIPVMSELSKPWAELALIYMQCRLND